MAKYRVFAKCETLLFIDVEAETPEQAMEMGEQADGGDFTECPDAEWTITEATPLNDQNHEA